jgi:uncharacterized membrane protein YeaQ/YmgE (transglycosylase-associated protein family)
MPDLMSILTWIILGAVAGWLANIVVNKGSGSLVTNIVVGIIGAFLGGWLFSQFGSGAEVTGFNMMSVLVAFVGAVVLLVILRLLSR